MNNKLIKFLSMLLLAVVLIGCNNSGATIDEPQEESKEQEDSVLRVAMSDQPLTLDRHITTALSTEQTVRLINETLVTVDSNYQVTPMLAETFDISEDGKTITFHLREGVKFHNGKEMTSEDVVASMNRWKEHFAIAKEKLENSTFEAVDTYTVELQLDQAQADIMDVLASETSAIMPKEVIDSAEAEGVTEFIGTGPYKFVEWKHDQYLHFTKFDDYQPVDSDADGLAGKKEPTVKDIYIEFVPDSSTKLAGIQTGEYDVALRMPYDNYDDLDSNPDLKTYMDAAGFYSVMYNKKQGPASDFKIRQAINAALDVEEIMMAAFPHEDFHELYSSYMDEAIAHWASDAGSESYNQNDPEKAKQLLEEAGYDGEEIVLLTHREAEFLYDGAVVIQQQLEKVGINLDLKITDSATVKEIREDPNEWDLLMITTSTVTSPAQLLEISPSWVGWMEDEKVINLLSEIEFAPTQEEGKALWDELQAYVWNDYLPITRLGSFRDIYVSSSKVDGFDSSNGPILWNITLQE